MSLHLHTVNHLETHPYVFDVLVSFQLLKEGGEEVSSLQETRSDTEDIDISSCQNSTDSYERRVYPHHVVDVHAAWPLTTTFRCHVWNWWPANVSVKSWTSVWNTSCHSPNMLSQLRTETTYLLSELPDDRSQMGPACRQRVRWLFQVRSKTAGKLIIKMY